MSLLASQSTPLQHKYDSMKNKSVALNSVLGSVAESANRSQHVASRNLKLKNVDEGNTVIVGLDDALIELKL